MHALLLLAGRSKRFWPLSEKSLFPICGTTLAEHQVRMLKSAGCKRITLVCGKHNVKELREMFGSFTVVEQKDLDMGMQGACIDGLKGVDEPVLIVSGNDAIDGAALKDLMAAARKPDVSGAILARKVSTYFPGGYLSVKAGRITGIIEKPGAGKEPSDLINLVAHIHNDPQALLAELKKVKSKRDDGYEMALQSLFASGVYKAVPYKGTWQAVKYPWHLLPLMEILLEKLRKPQIHKTAKIHKTAVIEGNVIIGEGTRVLPNATIVGPCTIGKNCIIGNNALVRGSSVGDGCVIGYNTEVKGSVLAGPVWTHMTYLGDSIIGRNVSFGGGCVTGNLRLDEGEIASNAGGADGVMEKIATGLMKLGLIVGDDCRFGIQTGSNPGVRIGGNTFVGGGCYITEDIPETSFVSMKDGALRVKPNTASSPQMSGREKYRKKL
jgi:bifunctional UDP-N-acetylglucosamine pyrophosphorylase/glucosamine-1-phosphate N-acetyltransferase